MQLLIKIIFISQSIGSYISRQFKLVGECVRSMRIHNQSKTSIELHSLHCEDAIQVSSSTVFTVRMLYKYRAPQFTLSGYYTSIELHSLHCQDAIQVSSSTVYTVRMLYKYRAPQFTLWGCYTSIELHSLHCQDAIQVSSSTSSRALWRNGLLLTIETTFSRWYITYVGLIIECEGARCQSLVTDVCLHIKGAYKSITQDTWKDLWLNWLFLQRAPDCLLQTICKEGFCFNSIIHAGQQN